MQNFVGSNSPFRRRPRNGGLIAAAIAAAAIACGAVPASAAILLQDNFTLGPRRDVNDVTVPVNIGTALAGKQAQVPGTADHAWTTSASPSWAFSATTADPFEAPGTPSGSVTYNMGDENPARPSSATALLAFAAPTGEFEESLDVVSFVRTDVTIGFTSSLVPAIDNFTQFRQFTLSLSAPFGIAGQGLWTLRSVGANGQSLSGTTQLQGFNRLIVRYNPVVGMVEGFVNGISTGTLAYGGGAIVGVGFSGNGTVDNFAVQSIAASPGVPEPSVWAMLIFGFAGTGCVLRRRRQAMRRANPVIWASEHKRADPATCPKTR